ncbi:MAG TPA: hypothetical protein VNL98_06875 [Gemmatimonadales bacterium]|nr:hypothetical protein [Gemmatimonadales bacterium]
MTWSEELQVEETSDVINVWPVVRVDPGRGFLVADMQEAQVRSYDLRGRLLSHFGSRGLGPGQFERPTVAIRLPSREILVAQRNGRLVVLDSTGTRALRTIQSLIFGIDDADVVDDSTVLLAGVRGDRPDSPRLHLWNFRTNEVRGSFFSPWEGYRYKEVASMAGWVQAFVRGDTLVATFAPSDTLYLFTTHGDDLGRLPLTSHRFRQPTPPRPEALGDPRAMGEWMATVDFVTGVYWTEAGFVVPYQSFRDRRPVWKIMALRRDGELWLDAPEAPRLMTEDPQGRGLVFMAHEAQTPNRWTLAVLNARH